MSERMTADPFADIGFRYQNTSAVPLGAGEIASVTPLTFEKALLVSEMRGRIAAASTQFFDDAVAFTAETHRDGNEDLLSFASMAHVCIDLQATDKKILADFKLYLAQHRAKAYCPKPVKSVFSATTFARWFNYRVLLCFDIKLWAESKGLEIGPTELGERLGVGRAKGGRDLTGPNASDFYKDSVAPAYEQAFNPSTYQTLYTLSQA